MARPAFLLGRDVQDATQSVTINIRRHHIDDATALNGAECVAGRCVLQALDAQYVWFYRSKAYVAWDEDTPILRYQNSTRLIRDVITILDDPTRPNSEIKPGIYDLRAPTNGQRLGTDRKAKGPRRGPKPNKSHHVTGRITAVALSK